MKGVASTGETIQLFRLDTIAPSTQRTKSKNDAQDRLFFSRKSWQDAKANQERVTDRQEPQRNKKSQEAKAVACCVAEVRERCDT